MADPISMNLREQGLNQIRSQVSPTTPGAPSPVTSLPPDQRVEVLQAAVEKLIKNSLPGNSRLQIERDKSTGTFIYRSIDPNTGEIIKQWPSESLLALRDELKTMEGMLLDKQV